jgi:Mce-associated membrane protein
MPPPLEAPDTSSRADTPQATNADDRLAQAEEEVTQAEARAEEARAHAAQLRQQAGESFDDSEASPAERTRPRRRWLWRYPKRKAVALGIASLLSCALFGASGYMEGQYLVAVHQRQHATEFTQAARRAAATLLSINADHAKEDLQRVIDDSTGEFQSQLQVTARNIADGIEKSKVSTKATVQAVAIQSITGDSAVVLIAAKSEASRADNAPPQPASWRLRINLTRDGGQLKMSKVEFV